MTSEQIAHLKTLAKNATPGPWHSDFVDGVGYIVIDGPNDEPIVYDMDIDHAEYIAACDPNTILSLIERIEYLENEIAEWEREQGGCKGP